MGVVGQACHLAMVTAVPRRKTTAVRGEGILEEKQTRVRKPPHVVEQVAVLEALAPEAEMATKHTKETIPTAVKVEHHRPDAAAFETMVCWQQEKKAGAEDRGGDFPTKNKQRPVRT